MNLGAIQKPKDKRDFILGKVQAPIEIPPSFLPDNSWLIRNYQGQTPSCGAHAGTHFKVILNLYTDLVKGRKTPRYGYIKLKDPKSPVYDGYPIDAGTDMRSIFKWLQVCGADDFEPLENDITLPLEKYCDPSVITPDMDINAGQSKIKSYVFTNPYINDIKQAIYQNKAVILLIKCDDGFWGSNTPVFTTPKYGHFVVADGYDENGIRIIDSADPNIGVKTILNKYERFIIEAGTAIDLPDEVVYNLKQQVNLLQKVVLLLKKLLGL